MPRKRIEIKTDRAIGIEEKTENGHIKKMKENEEKNNRNETRDYIYILDCVNV